MKSVGVQNQTEKKTVARHAKDMEKGSPCPKGMMETYFNYLIHPSVPNNSFRHNFVGCTVKKQSYTNGNINSCNHN